MNAEDTVLKPLTDYLAGLTPENLPMLRAEIWATVHCEQCKEEMDKYKSVYHTALQLRLERLNDFKSAVSRMLQVDRCGVRGCAGFAT
jgi:hypothetical protein